MNLWVDDIRTEPEGWTRAKTVTEAIRLLDMWDVTEVSLDHDISHKVSIGMGDARPFASDETFEPVARFISRTYNPGKILITIHTANSVAAEKMSKILERFNPIIRLSKPCNKFEGEP